MRRIASVLLAVSFFGNLFGGGKKEEAKPTPPPTTAVVETTVATEPPMSDEAFNKAMQDLPEKYEVYGDKLVVRWSSHFNSEENGYKRDYIPEEYVTQNADEIRGVVEIVEGFATTEYGIGGTSILERQNQRLTVTILDQLTGGEVAFRIFQAPAPERTSEAGVDYVDPQLVTDWIQEIWAEHMELAQYHDKIAGYHLDAFGGKIIAYDSNMGMYVPQYIPEDLMAQDASQVGAELFLVGYYQNREIGETEKKMRELHAILTIFCPKGNQVERNEYARTIFKADSEGNLKEGEVEAWVRENWDSAVKKGIVQVLNNYEPETEKQDSYDEMMMHGMFDMGSGDKLVCKLYLGEEGSKYVRQYLPEELMAGRPDQVGGILQISEAQYGYTVKLKLADINLPFSDYIVKESFATLDEEAIAEWAETEWKAYLAKQ